MSEGAILVWFLLTGLSVVFVSVDIRSTPAHPVLKWAFTILTLFTARSPPFSTYLCGTAQGGSRGLCDNSLAPGARVDDALCRRRRTRYHCRGSGRGPMALASVGRPITRVPSRFRVWLGGLPGPRNARDGGWRLLRSLKLTFLPELLSIDFLMAGMAVTMRLLGPRIDGSANPLDGGFWFVVSMALIAGFMLAYPINWWLVAKGLSTG